MRLHLAASVLAVVALGAGTAAAATGESVSRVRSTSTACQFELTDPAGPGVSLRRNGVEVGLRRTNDDPAMPTFRGRHQGVPVDVTLWKGTPPDQLAELVAQHAPRRDELTAASLAGAVEGEGEGEVSESFDDSGVLVDLETFAYRITTDGLVEHGSIDGTATVTDNAKRRVGKSDCVRVPEGTAHTVTITGPGGRFTLATGESERGDLFARDYPSTTTAVRYRTFIPAASVGSPCGTFRGDNRGFSSYFEEPNRTRASVFFNWPWGTIDTTKNIGTTHKLNSSGAVIQSATASAAGIYFHTASIAPTFGRIGVNHSVGNPLCSVAGPIAYNVIIEAWKDGIARISGTRLKVPNHEAYVYPTSGAYGRTIFTRSTSSFICLSLNCGQESLWETSP